MADLATNVLNDDGTAPTFTGAAAGGDTVEVGSGSDTFLVARNGHVAEDRTVTIEAPGETRYGVALPDKVIVIQESDEAWIPVRRDYNAGPNRANVTYSDSAADVTVAVIQVR